MGYECVLPFDTDNEDFVRGFEAGRLWEALKLYANESDTGVVGQLFHATNAEMVLRMFEALEIDDLRAEIHDDIWMMVRRVGS